MKKTIIMILTAIVCVIALTCSISTNEQVAYADEEQSISTLCAEYTQAKVANGLSLYNYISDFNNRKNVSLGTTSDIQAGTYFQNGCTFTYNSDTMINTCTVLSDDNIVKFIPKTLFTYENDTFYLGKGYGFYIKTTPKENYYLSNVILIDTLITSVGSGDYAYDVKIMPLANIDYYYISSSSVGVYPYLDNALRSTSPVANFNYNLVNTTEGKVAPALGITSSQSNGLNATTDRIFIKGHAADVSDISFGAEVYNVNSYNYGDTGYEIDNDYGYFFTGNNYYYNASKYNTEGTWESIHEIESTIISAVLGSMPNGVGLIYTILNTVYVVTNNVEQITNNLTYNVTNENYSFNELLLYNTRQTQKEAYGKLLKASAVLMNSPESDSVFFQENDYARAVYNISHTDRADNIKEYNKIRFNIGLKVGTHSFISEPLEYDINTPETKSVQAFENKTYYMVPGSHAYYTFMPAYSGTYTLNLGRTDLGVKVGGNMLTAENGVYSANLQANTAYTIELTNNTAQITTGSLYIDVETFALPTTVSPQGSQTEILNIVPTSDGIYSLTTGTGGKIVGVKYLNNGLKNVVGAEAIYSGESDCIELFLHANTAYYILVCNTDATNTTSFNVNASSVSRTCTANSSINLSLVANGNKKYFAITPSANGVTANITFSQLEGDDMYIFTVLDKNGALFNNFWYLSDGYLGINNLQTSSAPYYIGVRANSNVNTTVKVGYGNPEFEWEIYQGTTELSWDDMPVVLTQGKTYNLQFIIQDEIVVTDVIISTSGVPTSEVSLNTQTGALTIATNARVGRVFTVSALNASQSGTTFSQTLTLKVGFDSERISLGTIDYADSVKFAVNLPEECASYTYLVSGKNGAGTAFSINASSNATELDLLYALFEKEAYTDVSFRLTSVVMQYGSDTTTVDLTSANKSMAIKCDYDTQYTTGKIIIKTYVTIKNALQLYNLRYMSGAEVQLKNDIDLLTCGPQWKIIPTLNTTLNGNGYVIKNLTYNITASSGTHIGLIGNCNAYVKNVTLENVNITSSITSSSSTIYVGGIAGEHYGIMHNCKVSGSIVVHVSNSVIGGLVGRATGGMLTNSTFGGDASNRSNICGNGDVGGLAGHWTDADFGISGVTLSAANVVLMDPIGNKYLGGIVGYANCKTITGNAIVSSVVYILTTSGNTIPSTVYPKAGSIVGYMVGGTLSESTFSGTNMFGAPNIASAQQKYCFNGTMQQYGHAVGATIDGTTITNT